MIESDQLLLCPLPGILRVTVNSFSYDKQMTPGQMRILAVRLLQAAEEQDQNISFIKTEKTV